MAIRFTHAYAKLIENMNMMQNGSHSQLLQDTGAFVVLGW